MTGLHGLPDPFSRSVRPILTGVSGAVSTAHPLATIAAQEQLLAGGTAADAVVAAQAVLSVIAPESCGLGGDAFFLVRSEQGAVVAVNAAGASARATSSTAITQAGQSVTVPGMVAGWEQLLGRWGRFPLAKVLVPAIRLAENGFVARPQLKRAVADQRERLVSGGGKDWVLLKTLESNAIGQQPQLANTLRTLGQEGASWFYSADIANDICKVIRQQGGSMQLSDLASHQTIVCKPLSVKWKEYDVYLPPPMSQGVLLGMALNAMPNVKGLEPFRQDHIAIELTEAVFSFRHRVVEGERLFSEKLEFDPNKASNRGGPRAYLHTAGVAASDVSGLVVSSLVSLFDDFGSAIYVPSGGFALNNRACGFTSSPNELGPGKVPVHTLAPILLESATTCMALATPGADGQIQSILQVLLAGEESGIPLDMAIHQPRWRSEDGRLIIESGHPSLRKLVEFGHNTVVVENGDARLGSIVCAGVAPPGPFAVSDWRRESWTGVT
jgi:gamma-glutamyltranspeptidase/glutathione hydrolase